ncbi:hypothetical protein MILUP08_43474 [Micromonospora lupini str. Lupac 08]|uniref:Uncharacterized protein n=1 Tax=Micromonospora lupini str. Lupac 08 TaxID=1150864 RepID=I0L417_9ACTN|nr:hypothetical protein MILUP08_43474 [Micromonospora lupini str. Lupac 08]
MRKAMPPWRVAQPFVALSGTVPGRRTGSATTVRFMMGSLSGPQRPPGDPNDDSVLLPCPAPRPRPR